MNELLQKHGCANVFSVPEGLKELMTDISREVLREQPAKIFDFISSYLSVLLITREHGVMAVKILDDLCDCRPSVSEHLIALGFERSDSNKFADIIKEEIEQFEPNDDNGTIKEVKIMKRILLMSSLDEVMSAKVCQVARNAYRDFWYRKKMLEQSLKTKPDEPWEIAAEKTLQIYKQTKPSFNELNRAAVKIQAAYRGYHIRRNVLTHLKPTPKKRGPKVDLHGAPLDISDSREIDLGNVIEISVPKDDILEMFGEHATKKLGLPFNPMLTLTHVADTESLDAESHRRVSRASEPVSAVDELKVEPISFPQGRHSYESEGAVEAMVAPAPPSSQTASLHKISFSEVPPEIIPEAPVIDEVEEIMKPVYFEAAEAAESEIPEDIPDDVTEGETSEATDVPSVPETGEESEVEDDANPVITDEEEG
ncbi:uncharacterized protein LOC126975509 [Leptidea sinapis]|uniref:uncharacterized protein LOC126975509 n=1 Tax=Leptidea sinapis TaxID=189913 RepID=UPI00212F761A|nr:uncharacterized protein LOC126975509 [Leptidea sinapis]